MCNNARSKGITGVPMTIIDGKWAVSGGQSSDVFIQVCSRAFLCSRMAPLIIILHLSRVSSPCRSSRNSPPPVCIMPRRRFPATSSTPLSSLEMSAQMYVLSVIWDDLRYPLFCAPYLSPPIFLSVATKLFPFFCSLFLSSVFVHLPWSPSVVITSCVGVYDMPLLVLCSLPRLFLHCQTESLSNATTPARNARIVLSTLTAGPSSICNRTRAISYSRLNTSNAGRPQSITNPPPRIYSHPCIARAQTRQVCASCPHLIKHLYAHLSAPRPRSGLPCTRSQQSARTHTGGTCISKGGPRICGTL